MKNGACVFHPCGRGSLRLQTSWLGGRSSGAVNQLGPRPRLIHPPPRARVLNARICVVRSTFGGSAAAARSRKKRPHCLTFQLLPSHINEMQTSIPSHCARFQPNVLPVWLKPATIVSVPAVRHHSCRLSSERVNYVWVQTFGYSCLRLGDEVFFSTDPVNGCEANL